MKKSNKKIPKSHLPKFGVGGGTAGDGTEGTQNIYNDKRSSKLNIGQYANYATAAVNLGVGLSNNQKLSGAAKNQANANTINGTVDAVAGSATPWYGYAKTASGIGKSLTSPTSVTDPTTGETVTQSSNRTNQAFSDTFTPMHETAINDFTSGNAGRGALDIVTGGVWNTMDNYLNGTNEKKFDKAKANEANYNKQQTELANQQNAAAQQQQNDYINSAIQSGLANQQPQSSYVQYAMGGMKMQPNAEVEKQENTLNPDGSTNQYDGASHEQGGIPTNLDAGTLIFSDKLKMGGKTFAKLNKPNMTHKEDKILSDDKASAMSKLTANLMKQAKNKSSVELFEAQEALKQSKLDSYTKRLGGIMKYPNGGQITPQQYKQAQADSATIYKSGLNKIPNWQYPGFTDAAMREGSRINPNAPFIKTSNGQEYGSDGGKNMMMSENSNFNNFKPTMVPYRQTQIPADNNGVEKVENYAQPVGKPVNHPVYNQYIPGINKSEQKIVDVDTFRDGGKKNANNIDNLNARQQADYNTWYNANNQNEGFNADDYSVDNYMKQYESRGASNQTPNTNTNTATGGDTGNSNFDWKGLGTQALSFAANNAGNIYDMFRSNKPEVTKFQRATANLLDDSAAIRDANDQTRRAEYNVRNASGGNAGTYLSNRVGLNAQNIVNKDRIRQQYANANAGIANQVNQFNTGIANQEFVANEQNRAASRSTKQGAIASMGSNSANQMNDIRNTEMDQKKLDGLIKMYPAIAKDPKMLEYFMSYHK